MLFAGFFVQQPSATPHHHRKNILVFAVMRNAQENIRNATPAETSLFLWGFSSVMSAFGTFKFYSRGGKMRVCFARVPALKIFKFYGRN